MIILFFILLFVSPIYGKTIHVPSEKPTIQAGIDAAENGDTVLVANGTYTGVGNRDITYYGKAITVKSENGADSTIIDCEHEARGFIFQTGETNDSILKGFSIWNGYANYYNDGAGILCEFESDPIIEDCKIKNCISGYFGGGISCFRSKELKIFNCEVKDNQSDCWGGGISCLESSPTIKGCMITGNIAYGGLEVYNGGGGIWCFNPHETGSTPVITNCTISGNTTYYDGGGICIYNDANPVISNCTITNNLAQFAGAGISTNETSAEISNCLISDNYSDIGGGGIGCGYTFSGQSITIKNCIISENYADRIGGGLDCANSDFHLINCTIYGNSANNGGGIYCDACNVIDPIITNCIFWNNTPDEIKLKETTPVITYCDIKGGWQGEGNIDKKPLFVSIHDFEYLLHPKSPCIDAGDPSIQDYVYDWHPKCPEWYKDGARSDMGAYGGPGNKYWLKDRWKPISEKAKKE